MRNCRTLDWTQLAPSCRCRCRMVRSDSNIYISGSWNGFALEDYGFLWISVIFFGGKIIPEQRKLVMIWHCHDLNLARVRLKWGIMDGNVNGNKRFPTGLLKFWAPCFQIKSLEQVQSWWDFLVIPFASQNFLAKKTSGCQTLDPEQWTTPYPKKLQGDGSWWWQLAPQWQFAVPCCCSFSALRSTSKVLLYHHLEPRKAGGKRCFGIMWRTWDFTVGLHTHTVPITHTHTLEHAALNDWFGGGFF